MDTPLIAAQLLTQTYAQEAPAAVARDLERMSAQDAAHNLTLLSLKTSIQIWHKLTPGARASIFMHLPDTKQVRLLASADMLISTALLGSLSDNLRESLLTQLPKHTASEMRTLLDYPADSVGRIMKTKAAVLHINISAQEALAQLKRQDIAHCQTIFLIDDNGVLQAQVPLSNVVLAAADTPLSALQEPPLGTLGPLDSMQDAASLVQSQGLSAVPVVDTQQRLIGCLIRTQLLEAVKQDLATDLQTMVGVSPDEKALSSSFFAVKKRLPWLSINLLTAFLAAAIVGFFEGTIAQYTALAVLLPVAAGQSGNTGAQALAVTMRGLTLREITLAHWLRVTIKECGAGFMNGVAIAIICAIGVYFWSQNTGLSLIIGLSMIISMTIAGISGALVPIVLRRLGQDPAQSSSIILTTITDIAGFMSFLGIATMLSHMLEKSV